jgi:hypothetical protein
MRQKPLFLTGRVILFFTALVALTSCGGEPLHGMYDFSFPETAVCRAQEELIQFQNTNDSEMIMSGAVISPGTDPDGNFTLESMIIDGNEADAIDSKNGGISSKDSPLIIPAGATYAFKISYSPKTENQDDTAILDLAYLSPEQGIIQVTLNGTSTNKADNCATNIDAGQKVDFDGDVILTVKRVIAVTTPLGTPIRTDEGTSEFVEAHILLKLDKKNKKATVLPLIGDSLQLPIPSNATLAALISEETKVTIEREFTGSYNPLNGSITVEQVSIHLNDPAEFNADLVTDLTTDAIHLKELKYKIHSGGLETLKKLRHLDTSDPKDKKIVGSKIKEKDGIGTLFLVGAGDLKNVNITTTDPAKRVLEALKTSAMAVLIEGTIEQASP